MKAKIEMLRFTLVNQPEFHNNILAACVSEHNIMYTTLANTTTTFLAEEVRQMRE
ncbi:hypothetical protein YC2023_109904 [Brassica napus]